MRRLVVMVSVLVSAMAPSAAAQDDMTPMSRREVSSGWLELTVTLRPSSIRVGDRARLEMRVNRPDGAIVSWPSVGEFDLPELRAIVDDAPAAAVVGGVVEETYVVTLEPLRAGTFELGPIVIRAVDADGEAARVETSMLALEVRSVLEADAPLDVGAWRDAEEREREPAPPSVPAWALLGVSGLFFAGVVASAVGAVVCRGRWRPKKPVDPVEFAIGAAAMAAPMDDPAAAYAVLSDALRGLERAAGGRGALAARAGVEAGEIEAFVDRASRARFRPPSAPGDSQGAAQRSDCAFVRRLARADQGVGEGSGS